MVHYTTVDIFVVWVFVLYKCRLVLMLQWFYSEFVSYYANKWTFVVHIQSIQLTFFKTKAKKKTENDFFQNFKFHCLILCLGMFPRLNIFQWKKKQSGKNAKIRKPKQKQNKKKLKENKKQNFQCPCSAFKRTKLNSIVLSDYKYSCIRYNAYIKSIEYSIEIATGGCWL